MKRLAALALVTAACADEASVPPPSALRGRFPPMRIPADNPMRAAKAELGRMLFYDPILSTDRRVACATCHGEIWGLSDGLPRSVGVGGIGPVGTGRHGPTTTRRNASTLWNAAWRAALFWDGRSPSLEDQILGPMRAAEELGRPPDEVARELASIDGYVTLFRAAFPGEASPVTGDNLRRAIAAFERTLVSTYSPYDRYLDGDTGALDARATRGLTLFTALRCDACHTPPMFDRERYEPTLVAPDPSHPDDGRAEVTRDSADRGRFLVPTLRNVGESAPYFHDGSVSDLAAAVSLEARGRPGARALTDAERDDVVAFLRAGLTDLHASPERPVSVPSGLEVPVDGYRVPR